MDTNLLSDLVDLVGTGAKSANSLVDLAKRLKGLTGSTKPTRDAEVETLIANLLIEIANTKIANAELKFKLTELLEAMNVEKDRQAKLVGYVLHKTEVGGFAYAPKDTPPDHDDFHLICPRCYEDGIRSILQKRGVDYKCPRCSAAVPYSARMGIVVV